jgi:Fe2+ transport system protein B
MKTALLRAQNRAMSFLEAESIHLLELGLRRRILDGPTSTEYATTLWNRCSRWVRVAIVTLNVPSILIWFIAAMATIRQFVYWVVPTTWRPPSSWLVVIPFVMMLILVWLLYRTWQSILLHLLKVYLRPR